MNFNGSWLWALGLCGERQPFRSTSPMATTIYIYMRTARPEWNRTPAFVNHWLVGRLQRPPRRPMPISVEVMTVCVLYASACVDERPSNRPCFAYFMHIYYGVFISMCVLCSITLYIYIRRRWIIDWAWNGPKLYGQTTSIKVNDCDAPHTTHRTNRAYVALLSKVSRCISVYANRTQSWLNAARYARCQCDWTVHQAYMQWNLFHSTASILILFIYVYSMSYIFQFRYIFFHSKFRVQFKVVRNTVRMRLIFVCVRCSVSIYFCSRIVP